TVGMKPILVHGGGKSITRAMEEAGLTARFVQGRRYTDDATLDVVDRVLGYELNTEIADRIESLDGRSAPLNFRTTNVLYGKPIKLADADGGQLDLGWVGDVTKVDKRTIQNLCYAGLIPVIPSLCQMEGSSQRLNVNADTAAAAVAQAMGAEKLVYLSDIPGVLRERSQPDSLINSLTARQARELIASGVIDGGMIPKVQACLDVIDGGVKKVHIIDGRLRHSLLLEIFTRSGVGTEISQDG
ncbi:MAG TPA: acetylglutamate kinase, partial [Pirellulales bacterium]